MRHAHEGPTASARQFASLWERWHGPDGDVESCCIRTTDANDVVRPIHDRMPVILDPRHFDAWLDPKRQDAAVLAPLLRPFAGERMRLASPRLFTSRRPSAAKQRAAPLSTARLLAKPMGRGHSSERKTQS
ncbi:MAG TPA: SOS response-associated peptidase family protein [Gemmataceae bacterium]|nr:SOS response-associated peptidase family protein [Gemmataceae bacterium]